jgi:hypothetical protein
MTSELLVAVAAQIQGTKRQVGAGAVKRDKAKRSDAKGKPMSVHLDEDFANIGKINGRE